MGKRFPEEERMRVEYDAERDLLYLGFRPRAKAARTETICPGVYADFDREGKLIGLEILDASEWLGDRIQPARKVTSAKGRE